MAARRYFFFVISLIIFGADVKSDAVTFQNVTVWKATNTLIPLFTIVEEKIETIKSSNSLKENLPKHLPEAITITGKIPILYENSVADIYNVKSIHFSKNEIEEIRPGAFKNLEGLNTLMFSENNLTTLQPGIFNNLKLAALQVSVNPISTIPAGALRKMPSLKILDLTRNKLETFEDGVFEDLTNLESLDLGQNSIAVLPQGFFRSLTHLKLLILTDNKLVRIEKEVFDSSSIEHLDLTGNLISSLDEDCLDNLPHLNRIQLNFNRLTAIPEGVFSNRSLAQVELNNNNISYIAPGAFDNMPKLANILLQSNKLSKYDTRWFHNTPNIFRLFLGNNHIHEIPDEAFKNIYNHKEQWLQLRSNEIKQISPNTFKGLKRISTLDLSMNEIDIWQDKFLADAEVVYYLNLGLNKLSCIEGDLDQIFKGNNTYLQGNPLSTGCVKKINNWLSQNPGKTVET